MKRVCIVTATRAEFGLLLPLIRRVLAQPDWELKLAVTGTHLSSDYGETVTEIESSGVPIDVKLDILSDQTSETYVSDALGQAVSKFGKYFHQCKPDLLVILGDRYEMLGVAAAAMTQKLPIAHIHGGETTEGAMDEAIRHAITKMSYLHFTSCEACRKRVIQLGESPDRVFNVGALGVENAKTLPLMRRSELGRSIGFDLSGDYLLVTFHPVTLDAHSPLSQLQELLDALDDFPRLHVIFTKANADGGGAEINRQIDEYVQSHSDRARAYFSMGYLKYLSAMRDCAAVVGNSSSGILEAPSFCVPAVNIGDRQKGRIQAKSVINCPTNAADISAAIEKAMDQSFRKSLADTQSPYGEGDASRRIAEVVKQVLEDGLIDLKKSFYDVRYQ